MFVCITTTDCVALCLLQKQRPIREAALGPHTIAKQCITSRVDLKHYQLLLCFMQHTIAKQCISPRVYLKHCQLLLFLETHIRKTMR